MGRLRTVFTDPAVLGSLATLAASLTALRYGVPMVDAADIVTSAATALSGLAAGVFGLRTWAVTTQERLKK